MLLIFHNVLEVLIWCEGNAPKTISYKLPKDCESDIDYIWDIVPSPDSTSVLFRGGSSGAGDVNLGILLCLNLRTHRCHALADSVRKAVWVSPKRIRITEVEFVNREDSKGTTLSTERLHTRVLTNF